MLSSRNQKIKWKKSKERNWRLSYMGNGNLVEASPLARDTEVSNV